MNISFKKIFYSIACVSALIALLYFGRPILVSLTIALLSSFILHPIAKKFESWGLSRVFSTITTLLVIVLLTAGVFYFFGSQIAAVVEGLSNFERKLAQLTDQVVVFINERLSIISSIDGADLLDKSQQWVQESSGSIVTNTVNKTVSVLSGIIMVSVYTFLFLIYRGGLKRALVSMASKTNQEKVSEMITEIQKVGQSYIFGMTIMIGILGITNSLVLLAFGIDYPFFFGFLAALLVIIPYVGTTLGASIPVLYAFMTHSTYVVPLGIMFSFWIIQLIESNFLSPKIVGGNLNVNALVAIISLIIGGFLWGVAGMVLFLPLTAVLKVFCSYFEELKPLSQLLGNKLYQTQSSDK